MTTAKPRFSIIVATFNAAHYLERCLRSVECQVYPHWEIIIQDGGSTDATPDIVANHADTRICWHSAPDKGIYDAWNKAVARATGDWALFLGADDCLLNEQVLAQCTPHLQALDPQIIFAYGILMMGENGEIQSVIDRSRYRAFANFFSDMGLPFPATFIRVPFLKAHPFDTIYKIAGDFDLCAKYITLENVARIPVCVSYYELGGISSKESTQRQLARERQRVVKMQVKPRLAEIVRAVQATEDCAVEESGWQE